MKCWRKVCVGCHSLYSCVFEKASPMHWGYCSIHLCGDVLYLSLNWKKLFSLIACLVLLRWRIALFGVNIVPKCDILSGFPWLKALHRFFSKEGINKTTCHWGTFPRFLIFLLYSLVNLISIGKDSSLSIHIFKGKQVSSLFLYFASYLLGW